MTATQQAPTEQEVLVAIAGLLTTVLDEIGLDDVEITMETSFTEDLEIESIDLVTLAGALRAQWGDRVNVADFIAGMELDEIIGLKVGALVSYVVAQLA
jgi:acyl carrier protein